MRAMRAALVLAIVFLVFCTAGLLVRAVSPAGWRDAAAVGALEGGQPQINLAQRELTASPAIKAQLVQLRGRIATEKLTFEVGYTTALDEPLEKLTGLKLPENLAQEAVTTNQKAQELLGLDLKSRDAFAKANPGKLTELQLVQAPCAALASYDWRTKNKVTPVRGPQNGCGSCWAFTTLGAFESSYAIRNNVLIDASEQQILNCSGAGSCAGGWWMPAFDYLIHHGVATEAAYPYTHNDLPCRTGVAGTYFATAWGFVHAAGGIPTVAEMKAALCRYGALAVAVRATPLFQAYTGGVFNEHDPGPINHGVTLIGWSDANRAWIIKNSWGPGWGGTGGYGTARGYMMIAWDSNHIGVAASWVQARSRFYRLPPIYFERIKKLTPVAPIKH